MVTPMRDEMSSDRKERRMCILTAKEISTRVKDNLELLDAFNLTGKRL